LREYATLASLLRHYLTACQFGFRPKSPGSNSRGRPQESVGQRRLVGRESKIAKSFARCGKFAVGSSKALW
jgi:hypothetical protein